MEAQKPTIIRRSSTSNITSYDYLFKISLIGDSGTGKTSILLRFTDNVFKDDTQSTIGVDFKIVSLKLDKAYVKMQIWDTCGSERFKGLTSSFIKSCNIFILVFDLTKHKTFESLENWIKLIFENTAPKFMCLVGNKCDQLMLRQVTQDEIVRFCEKHGVKYIETSALGNENIEEVFIYIAQTMYTQLESRKSNFQENEFAIGADKGVKIDNISLNTNLEKKSCCYY
jgi:small GTP-binding protein